MNDQELVNWLVKQICDPTGNPRWRQPYWDEESLYICNGSLLVRLSGEIKPDPKWYGQEDLAEVLENLKAVLSEDRADVQVDLPVISAIPEKWENPFELVDKKCRECNGTGEVTCEYGHDHECPDCDGEGTFQIAKSNFDSSPTKSQVKTIKVGNKQWAFNTRYLWIADKVKGHRPLTSTKEGRDCIHLVFEGGDVLMMRCFVNGEG